MPPRNSPRTRPEASRVHPMNHVQERQTAEEDPGDLALRRNKAGAHHSKGAALAMRSQSEVPFHRRPLAWGSLVFPTQRSQKNAEGATFPAAADRLRCRRTDRHPPGDFARRRHPLMMPIPVKTALKWWLQAAGRPLFWIAVLAVQRVVSVRPQATDRRQATARRPGDAGGRRVCSIMAA